MKMLAKYISLVVLGITTAGCGTAAKQIQMMLQSERTDVFSEVKEEGIPPKGLVDLVIKASIKTHPAGYYILESRESLHGKHGYPFVINIDGQAVVWKVEGQRHIIPAYDKEGKTSTNSEAGEGIKYVLEKRVRLAAGSHKVFFGLPEDKYYVEVEITLKEGEPAVLEFKPVYRYKTRPTRIPTFLKGINKYEVFLNGNPVISHGER